MKKNERKKKGRNEIHGGLTKVESKEYYKKNHFDNMFFKSLNNATKNKYLFGNFKCPLTFFFKYVYKSTFIFDHLYFFIYFLLLFQNSYFLENK